MVFTIFQGAALAVLRWAGSMLRKLPGLPRPQSPAVPSTDANTRQPPPPPPAAYSVPVNVLYSPPSGMEPELDIVFFHGLQLAPGGQAWRDTWTQRGSNGSVCWPQEWLPEALGDRVRVLSLSYSSQATNWTGAGNKSVVHIAKNVREQLIGHKVGDRPVLLVGHSLGGLVIKALVRDLNQPKREDDPLSKKNAEQARKILAHLKAAVFYAVPHSGAELAKFARVLDRWTGVTRLTGLMEELTPFNQDMEILSKDFLTAVHKKEDMSMYAFLEGLPMGPAGVVVSEAAAMRLVKDNYVKLEDSNHVDVCKPINKQHVAYAQLVAVIEAVCDEVSERRKEAQQLQ